MKNKPRVEREASCLYSSQSPYFLFAISYRFAPNRFCAGFQDPDKFRVSGKVLSDCQITGGGMQNKDGNETAAAGDATNIVIMNKTPFARLQIKYLFPERDFMSVNTDDQPSRRTEHNKKQRSQREAASKKRPFPQAKQCVDQPDKKMNV